MKRIENIYKTLGIPIVVVVIAFTYILLEGMTSLRIKELRINLQRIGMGGFNWSNMALLVKYNQLKKNDLRPSNIDSTLSEVELMGVLTNESRESVRADGLAYYFEGPILFVVNALSYLLGSTPIKEFKNDENLGLLTLGAFYERKRDYLNGIKIFSTSIEIFQKERDKLGFSFLHRGFCFMMLGETTKAFEDYKATILLRGNHEEGAIAELLLEQLQKRQKKIALIDKKKESVRKGLDYYQVMTYTRAIKTFNELEKKKKVTSKLHFYRGRAYEEIGFLKNAVHEYQVVVKKYPNSSFAKKAYRRLYILGAYYEGNQALKEKAKQKLAKLGDTRFIEKSESIEDIVNATVIVKLPETKSIEKAVKVVIENTNATVKSMRVTSKEEEPEEDGGGVQTGKNDFLSSLSEATLDEKKDITLIEEDIKEMSNTLERASQVLKAEKKVIKKEEAIKKKVRENELKEAIKITGKEKKKKEIKYLVKRKKKKEKNKNIVKKRTDKEILFDPKTSVKERKKLIKKLYVKISKIITSKGTFIGHVLEEDTSMVYMITPKGRVQIKINEIGLRLRSMDSKILLK